MAGLSGELTESYRYCRSVARKRARNFYYGFIVLPREKSEAMCAVYAFMRYCDDIADDPSAGLDKRQLLSQWRDTLEKSVGGRCDDSLILPAFRDTITRFDIPVEYFRELIDGAEQDLTISQYDTFAQLYDYCYKVASVVGLVCIHIFGFDSPSARKYAEYCGIGFQLTNILRDIKEDQESGRVYIPEEDLRSFHYGVDDIANEVRDERFARLMQFEARRARSYYNAAVPLIGLVHPSGRSGLGAMVEIYSSLLDEIEHRRYDVFSRPVSLSGTKKLSIAARTLVRSRISGRQPFPLRLPS